MNIFFSFQNVCFSYPESVKPLFSDLTVQFSSGWTAVTGPNGGGKSTLLKLASGLLSPDSGTVSGIRDCLYCGQDAVLPLGWENLFWSADPQTRKIFSRLGVGDDFPFRWESLSGGEKKRMQVALALCSNPGLLALDEPTNHLDASSARIITDALRLYGGIGLLVSHNRALMDCLCRKTLYLENGECLMYSCGVTAALELREERRKSDKKNWQDTLTAVKSAKKQVQHWTEEAAKTAGRMSKSRLNPADSDARSKINLAKLTGKDAVAGGEKSRLSSKLSHNQKKLDSLEKPLMRKSGVTFGTNRLERDFLCALPAGIVRPQNEGQKTAQTGETYELHIPDLRIRPFSRIALTGENGSGKTLLIRRLLSVLNYDVSGALSVVQNGIVYVPQEINATLEKAYMRDFYALTDNQKGAVLSQMYRLGCDPLSFLSQSGENTVTVSPGELRKLVIALALQTDVSFFILDEPTNHLDIEGILLLEKALKESSCALLLCSHDEYFIKSLANETWTAERAGVSCGRLVFR